MGGSMKPTEEQIKKFWEWCGLYKDLATNGERYWFMGEEIVSPTNEEGNPIIDLNNLFKYAVPKLIATGHWLGMITTQLSSDTQYTFAIYVEKYKDKAEHEASDKDPALALFWAISKVIEG
jgi:hypothetical protein